MNDFYIPEFDILETLADGRLILLAPAGVPVPMHVALAKGFIKDGTVVPSEIKSIDDDVDAARGATGVSVTMAGKKKSRK